MTSNIPDLESYYTIEQVDTLVGVYLYPFYFTLKGICDKSKHFPSCAFGKTFPEIWNCFLEQFKLYSILANKDRNILNIRKIPPKAFKTYFKLSLKGMINSTISYSLRTLIW